MNQKSFQIAREKITNFTDKLGENFFDAIMEDDNSTYDMGRGIVSAFSDCRTEREFEVANNMLMATCGYSFETLVERIEELDESGHLWESC